jgi:hypothetical protein
MIYEMDKRQLLRLWSVLSSFGEIRETKDPIMQSEILRRALLVLTDFVWWKKPAARDNRARRVVLHKVTQLTLASPMIDYNAALQPTKESGPCRNKVTERYSRSQFPAAIGNKLQPAELTYASRHIHSR